MTRNGQASRTHAPKHGWDGGGAFGNLPASMTHGASPLSTHSSPISSMVDVQHSSAEYPSMSEQPSPPHWPQPSTQQTPESSIPRKPLLHSSPGHKPGETRRAWPKWTDGPETGASRTQQREAEQNAPTSNQQPGYQPITFRAC